MNETSTRNLLYIYQQIYNERFSEMFLSSDLVCLRPGILKKTTERQAPFWLEEIAYIYCNKDMCTKRVLLLYDVAVNFPFHIKFRILTS